MLLSAFGLVDCNAPDGILNPSSKHPQAFDFNEGSCCSCHPTNQSRPKLHENIQLAEKTIVALLLYIIIWPKPVWPSGAWVSPEAYAKVPLSMSSSPFKLSLIWFAVQQTFSKQIQTIDIHESKHKMVLAQHQPMFLISVIILASTSFSIYFRSLSNSFHHSFRNFSFTISKLRLLLITWNSRPRYRVTPVISLICFRVKALRRRWWSLPFMFCKVACIQQILGRYGYHIYIYRIQQYDALCTYNVHMHIWTHTHTHTHIYIRRIIVINCMG